ncbi:MAG: glycosyltransferase family 39 protein [Gammaproteobacteria bacterium]|jgi:4-amino-4-deoxy-L-arabinose transferase-like glycosyltransferase|nr:glycosyltransferase family 39 protein [Gammaproteobacteria bacterium]
MNRDRAWDLIAVVALALAFWWQLGALPLTDVDEGAFSEATREMVASGNYVSPRLDGEPRHDKPILIYWLQAGAVHALGLSELALRLPSALAATLWALVLFRFVRVQADHDTARAAVLVMVLSVAVGLIAKAAIADALLNLWLAAAFFDIWRHAQSPSRATLLRAYVWMGLGFLTKGPIAVALPVAVSLAWFASEGRLRDWLRAAFAPAGWLVFLAVVLPWHVAVYLDQGSAFFEGFYLHHNVGRYSETMEGHGGALWFYVVWLPVILLPYSGLLAVALARLRADWADPLRRYLWLWFAVAFAVFSLSSTQLPHYMLYGATPLFVLMAMHRDALRSRVLAFGPPLLAMALLLLVPDVLGLAQTRTARLYDRALIEAGLPLFDAGYRAAMALGLAAIGAVALWRRVPPFAGLVTSGFVLLIALSGFVAPRYLSVAQAPVREAAAVAQASGGPVVAYRVYLSSFSVYRQAPTLQREPRPGDLVLTRVDRLGSLERLLPGVPHEILFRRAGVVLLRLGPAPSP